MANIKTSELTGPALDWAVAKCEGLDVSIPAFADTPWIQISHLDGARSLCPKFSTDWAQGGPIIGRGKIDLFNQHNGYSGAIEMATRNNPHPRPYFGLTPLIAAMRCFVASELGNEVDVPEELA